MKPNISGNTSPLEKNSNQSIPIYCSRCGSTDIRGYGKQILSLRIEQKWQCKKCGHIFWERTREGESYESYDQ